MLTRKKLVQFGQSETSSFPFQEHLAHRHSVIGLDLVTGAVLHPVLEQGNAPTGRQRSTDTS